MPVFRRHRAVPYHYEPKTKMLKIGKRDFLRLDDCLRGTVILGGTGSGKTSGSARTLAKAYLKAGFGGLVMCAHDAERAQWEQLAKETGRAGSIVVMDASGKRRINFLDYAMATLGEGGFNTNLLDIIKRIAEAGDVAEGNSNGGENKFFYDSAFEMLGNVFPILHAVYGTIRLRDVMTFIDTAPKSPVEMNNPEWTEHSFCAKTLALASLLFDTHHELEIYCDYWSERFPNYADRTRSSVVATISSLLYPFMTGKLHELFCTDTNIVPQLASEGAIIILDLPVHLYGKAGATAQAIFKYLFQRAMEQRERDGGKDFKKSRCVMLWADECQYFLSGQDTMFFSNARRYRCCGVYITQDIKSFYAALGSGNEHGADALLGKFQNRIWHTNADHTTNEDASRLIGDRKLDQLSKQQTEGTSTGGGSTQAERDSTQSGQDGRNVGSSTTVSQQLMRLIPPDFFTNKLRIGTKSNKYRVDAIMLKSGHTWRHTRENYVIASFDQRV